jgi:hypothetical protein
MALTKRDDGHNGTMAPVKLRLNLIPFAVCTFPQRAFAQM